MSSEKVRIPTVAHLFAEYMDTTDNLQLSAGTPLPTTPPTPQLKWQNWAWTAAQSAAWTAFRNQSDSAFAKVADKKHSTSANKDTMKLVMKNTRSFDNNKLTGAHLLDKVALNGTTDDCETFHVKRGTALAGLTPAATTRHIAAGTAIGPGSGILVPAVTLKSYVQGGHHLNITNPAAPKSKAEPAGIKFTKVYSRLYIAATPLTATVAYVFMGNAKRGAELCTFTAAQLSAFPIGTEIWVEYSACYESSKGVLGDRSTPIHVQLVRP